MRRRNFITLMGSAAILPLAARAQPSAMPVIGWLSARSPAEAASVLQAFRQGLGQVGYFEGKNITIEYRWAEGHYERLPEFAAELVRRQVAVIAATGGEPSPLAAKAATTSIPIVFTLGGYPVETGLVASLGRPGGNLTGTTIMALEMASKRLDLARQLVPNTTAIAMLINPRFPTASAEAREVQNAARSLGIPINLLNASTENEIDAAFTTAAEQKNDALIMGTVRFCLANVTSWCGWPRVTRFPRSISYASSSKLGPDKLRPQYRQRISTDRGLHGSDPQWRKSGRLAGRATNAIPALPQPQDRKDAGPPDSAAAARAGR